MNERLRDRAPRAAMLAIFAILVLARMPLILLHGGRFWAEEGVVYFVNAWRLPWYAAWFAVHTGYLNVAAAFATWLGLSIGGLAHAPLVTVLIALLLQCLPAFAIVTHDFPWRRSIVSTGAALLVCAVPPVMGEVWLNTITSQFHLGLFAALILAAPPAAGALFASDCAVLALAVLSGPVTSFLTPLFALKAALRRDRTWAQAAIVLLGCCIQVAIYLAHFTPERGGRLGAAALLSVISLHTIVLQFAGVDQALRFAAALAKPADAHGALIAGTLIFCGFHGVAAWMAWRAKNAAIGWFLVAGATIALVSFTEALQGTFQSFLAVDGGQRYAFIPLVLNGLVVAGLAAAAPGMFRWPCRAAALLIVLVSLANEGRDQGGFFADGPAWAPQVAAWRANPAARFTIWPGPPWGFALPPR